MGVKRIWTIGHSILPFEDFVRLLHSFGIELVCDVRNYPGSRKFPQFNKEALEASLRQHDIDYIHLKELGGRRRPDKNSENTGWRSASFRGYADYMKTDAFANAAGVLVDHALKRRTAFMCSEAVWWRCHRSLISDYLKLRDWKVMHIMGVGKDVEHPYTSPAKIIDGQLNYGVEGGA